MWETFISWYINNYLGKYVENLNSQQLSFALRQGELELENVPLKKNIFRSWGLPIEVKSGVVGRIKIEFNLLKYLRNEPVLISIDNIYLVAGPLNLAEWDPVEEAALAHETKMSALDSQEGRWKAQFDLASNSSSYYSSLYFSSMQIGASIVTKVVENLQLNVHNVHIRFEEELGENHLVAFGLTLKSLTAQSCDSNWDPLSTSSSGNNSDSSFKTLHLTEFAIYCDPKAEKFSNLNPVDLITSMNKIVPSRDYLLCPVSAEARISKNNFSRPLASSSKPRFDVQLTLDKVPLHLSDAQFRTSFHSYKSFTRLYRNCRLRHYRPFMESAKEAPLLWWRYAVRAILAYRGYRRRTVLTTLEEVLQRARDNVAFVQAYEQHLKQELLSGDFRKLKDRMEAELHYDEIIALREVAMRRMEFRSEGAPPEEPFPKENQLPPSSTNENASSSTTSQTVTNSATSTGVFSYIFPSWSNWLYSAESLVPPEPAATIPTEEFENEIIQLRKSESELDESILVDVKSFGRDALLARFKFFLKKGTVTLSRKSGQFLEMDFLGVDISTEFRPRSGAHNFNISLASLSLRDCSTKSLVVSPHSALPLSAGKVQSKGSSTTEAIFKLSYERIPHKKVDNRISLTTKPMDLVIYPVLWKEVTSFFAFSDVEDYLEVPQTRYEMMKEKTKEELRTYWERLINSRASSMSGVYHSSWEICLDISAPQIVIYGSDLVTPEPTPPARPFRNPAERDWKRVQKFIVFDLGRFRFTNMTDVDEIDGGSEPGRGQGVDDEDDDENEEFMTPCSSPVPEKVSSEGDSDSTSSRPSLPDLAKPFLNEQEGGTGLDISDSLSQLQAKLYKKYKLEITDIQVIVVEGKSCKDGSWKIANSRCTSLLHLVDRFSINLQLERRLVYSEDPEWPALTVMATLPKLNLHLNKSKVLSIRSVLSSYFGAGNEDFPVGTSQFNTSLPGGSQNNLHMDQGTAQTRPPDKSQTPVGSEQNNCKLFLAQFTIQSVAVEIQSRGRSIAELQITGARTTLTKWTKHTSISFVLHSILLADAVQTFGPDFELLLASHKHVSMDSVSGSLMDSDPTSPMSPQSPSSPLPFSHPKPYGAPHINQLAIPSELHSALLHSLLAKGAKQFGDHGIQSPTYDSDALITAELMLVNTDEEDVAILSVLFNNLDVIANQETLVEIFQFLQEIMPEEQKGRKRAPSASTGTFLQSRGRWKVETSFDFSRLNVLLLRGMVGKDGHRSGRKIATATACDARVGFSLSGNVLKVDGSLGGLQMLNLTPEGKYHQRVLSVGKDPLVDVMYNVFSPMPKSTGGPLGGGGGGSNASALDFTFEKSTDPDSDTIPVFTMRMASVIYTHCPILLIDLKKCIDEFQVPLGTKLKSAAAQIAMGLVRQDTLHGIGSERGRSPFGSFSVSLDKLSGEDGAEWNCDQGPRNPGIKVDITFESPVIALPRSRTSSEVLVANLGQITISGNGRATDDGFQSNHSFSHVGGEGEGRNEFNESFISRHSTGVSYSLLIRDVSLYSLDLKERWSMIDNLRMTYPTSNRNTLIRAQELYYCDPSSMARPILHNTVLQFVVDYGISETGIIDAEREGFHLEDDGESIAPKLGIQGRVVNPLKVSVTPGQYAQVLDSLGNIAAGEDDFLQGELKVESMEVLKGRWKEELNQAKFPATVHLPSPTRFENDSLSISATFEVPELIVELVLPEERVMNGEIPQLSLSCSELSFECEKKGFVMDMKVSLKSLTLEDTAVPKDSRYRLLAMSQSSEIQNNSTSSTVTLVSSVLHRNQNISTSCPDLAQTSPITIPEVTPSPFTHYFTPITIARTETSSLPDHLDPDDIFSGRFHQVTSQKSSRSRSNRSKPKRVRDSSTPTGSNAPATPPPSPRPMDIADNLVTIQTLFVDRKSPDFLGKYKGIHKSTNVEFNTLDVVLTPSTFICLRRFFSEAFARADFDEDKVESKQAENSRPVIGSKDPRIAVHSPSEDNLKELEKNTEMEISVKALRMKLAETSGTIGEVEVTDVMCRIQNQGNDFYGVDGRMGSLQVKDVSPQAGKYPVKFIFQGKQALDFNYCRKGTEAKFRLEMASVLYIHTHRFYSEFWALVSSLFGRAGPRENEIEPRASQPRDPVGDSPLVILNIQAGAPVIFLPYSSTSTSLLVADLGHLSVRNKFMEESDVGRAFDYISVDLLEMDLYSAQLGDETKSRSRRGGNDEDKELKTWIFDTQTISKTARSSSLLKNKCALNLKVKRLLNRSLQTSPTQASLSIQGTLSTVFATLNLEKYKLIRGLLQYNFGEQFEPTVTRPSSPSQKRRQSMELSTVIARQAQASASVRVELTIELDLVNVTVEITKEDDQKLSRVDFLRSKFTFSNSSDGTRDIDLASQEILVSDIRCSSSPASQQQPTGTANNKWNVFTNILQQSMSADSSTDGVIQSQADGPSTSSSFKAPTKLRAEVHLRETQRGSNVTILLNNLRLMLILDWWIEVQSFLSEHIPEPPPLLLCDQLEVNEIESAAEARLRNISPLLNRSKELMSPVTVSTGIVTKRAPILDVPNKTFDFKLNVSNCELVVVEDNSVWDTNAVILKMTAALTYRPHLERPISCNIMESELFSCVLGIESETALSILDPTNVSIEVVRMTKAEPQGILDATLSPSSMDKILKIRSTQICLRLSYYDMRMFLQLLERFSKEAQDQLRKHPSRQNASIASDGWSGGGFLPTGQAQFNVTEESVSQLLAMGFSRGDSCEALLRFEGRVEEAAILLSSPSNRKSQSPPLESDVENHRKLTTESPKFTSETDQQGVNTNGKQGVISGIEIKCTNLSICVIDDCKDADVPLAELNLGGLELTQNCLTRATTAEAVISIDYYNRELCGWEPLLEPWKCSLGLQQNERGQLGKYSPSSDFPTKAPELEVSLTSLHVMNINFTSTLLSLYKMVSSNWSEDDHGHTDKRRSPFVPFVLKNETGSTLWFSTIISNQEEVLRQQTEGKVQPDGTRRIQVINGGTQTFSFEGRGKLRHRNTHQLKMHQLVVRVDGWFDSSPVSVDRVGTYFRDVTPVSNVAEHFGMEAAELPSTRLVFEVSLHGSAQKLVRIRSALMVKNTLPQTMELKLENTIIYPAFERIQTGGGSYCVYIPPHQTCPIPLHSVCSQIWIRPILSTEFVQTVYSYCSKPLPMGRDAEGLRTCTSLAASNRAQPYRFCVAVKRDEFPADIEEPKRYRRAATFNVAVGLAKRANLITILSPLTIINLLPYEVAFEIKEQGGSNSGTVQNGHITAGKKHGVTNVDTTEALEISFSTENFPNGTSIGVSTSSSSFVTRLKLLDTQKRPLYLNARVSRGDGGTITVVISSQYWIVNKSGLPLIIKQEGVSGEAAGQFQEHEQARMIIPLLYSFYDPEGVSNVTVRVGSGLHPSPAKPQWCRSFPLSNGTRVRKLNVGLSHSQPEIVYLIGLEVSDGKGRYRDSKILTIAPRFIIENRSSRRMQICQRNFATSFLDPGAEATHLTLPPGCTLPFHWPRLDKDQLLCIRLLDVRGGVWSGGFPIENVLSFHINIRDFEGACYFLRVETVVEGATYFVVFSDTDQLPPPFRIDNFSLVPIIIHQSNVGDERLKLVAKPSASIPYACDEPTQPPNLTLAAPGGTSAIAKMDDTSLGLVAHMTYENFFYIALTVTFPRDEGGGLGMSGMETLQLVLDVPEGCKIVLRKKEAGNRNQLWRVNADGLIEHEGSSPPRDIRKPIPQQSLVLDVAGQAIQPTQWVPLMLRKPDKRRACTQHWEFTKEGRLKCTNLNGLFVQAKDGFGGLLSGGSGRKASAPEPSVPVAAWQMWNEVVFGPPQPVSYVRTDLGIPAEEAVGKQKLRPGSGRLSVHVETDGPTRVLRILDDHHPPVNHHSHSFEGNSINTIPKMSLNLELQGGLGLSLISCNPRQELVYALLSKPSLHWLNTEESESVSVSVENLQIDNQLRESEKSVAVYVTSPGRGVDDHSIPALSLKWMRLKSKLNAHLFKDWDLFIKPLNMIIEEKLLLELCKWIGLGTPTAELTEETDEALEVQKALINSTSLTTKRFYFGHLKIFLNTVRLSVLTSSRLPVELARIKRRLGLTLIRFEETLVELDAFHKQHPFETFDFLLASILKHYKEELLSQALLVLGSVDFLGNPVGFVNDVTEGVSSLIHEGSFDALFRNVTHGLSNSAAKVTGSLGDGLTRTLTLDSKHEEWRRSVRDDRGSAATPLNAGIKGLSIGLVGGLTSIFLQTYEGVVSDGLTGLVSGLGKGIVGTVTKPAVGVLDLAAGMALAVRDNSRSATRMLPSRLRRIRVAAGNGGLLPPYSEGSAAGQELMFEVNGLHYSDVFIGCESVKSGEETYRFLVSSERVTVFTLPKSQGTILDIPIRDILDCCLREVTVRGQQPATPTATYALEKKLVIEFTAIEPKMGTAKRQVTVENEQVAKTIVQEVNYARILCEEMRHSQINTSTTAEE